MLRPWFPFYASDWLSSNTVAQLSYAERGVFIELLARAWLEPDGMLSNDEATVCKMVPRAKRSTVRRVLSLCFFANEEQTKVSNPRLKVELARTTSVYVARVQTAENARKHRLVTRARLRVHSQSDSQSQSESESEKEGSPLPPKGEVMVTFDEKSEAGKTGACKANDTKELEDRLFACWLKTMGLDPDRTKFTKQRREKARARLREGYTEQDLTAAIAGCKASQWHMGDNTDGKIYNDLTLIFRDGAHVERFRNATEPRKSNGHASPKPDEYLAERFREIDAARAIRAKNAKELS